MAFLVSPGVEVKEIDATNVIPAVSTSIGGSAGYFNWGPIGVPVSVGSEKELETVFGKPDSVTAAYFLPMGGFLKYGQQLKVSRAYDAASFTHAITNYLLIIFLIEACNMSLFLPTISCFTTPEKDWPIACSSNSPKD